jgi:hypothetical protein
MNRLTLPIVVGFLALALGPVDLNAGELLPIDWKIQGDWFLSTEEIPAGSTCKVKVVKWGKAGGFTANGTPTSYKKVAPGSVTSFRIGAGFSGDRAEVIYFAVGEPSRSGMIKGETPISATKLASGSWLLKFTVSELEVKVYGEDF